MSESGWVILSEDGKRREVDAREEAERVKEDLEDLGLEVDILPISESEDSDIEPEAENDVDANPPLAEDSHPQKDIIRPVALDDILNMYDEYEDLKSTLISEEDIQEGDGGGRYIKKSGWRKIATAFNLDVEIVDHHRTIEDGIISYTVEARATAPNGKTVTSVAMAQSTEPNFTEIVKWENKTEEDDRDKFDEDPDIVRVDGAFRRVRRPNEVNEHDLITLAATRAKNRAISDLIGGGEMSAEEIKK